MAQKKEPIVHPYENESIIDKLGRFVNEMDFIGQEHARKFALYTQVLSAVIGYLIGWQQERLELTVFIILGWAALLVLLIVPGWPLFRQHELKWLDTTKLKEYVREHGKIESKKNQ